MSTSTRSVNSEMFLFFVTLPRTGLALASVPIRYLDNDKNELHYQYIQYREKHPKSEHWRTCVLFVDIP